MCECPAKETATTTNEKRAHNETSLRCCLVNTAALASKLTLASTLASASLVTFTLDSADTSTNCQQRLPQRLPWRNQTEAGQTNNNNNNSDSSKKRGYTKKCTKSKGKLVGWGGKWPKMVIHQKRGRKRERAAHRTAGMMCGGAETEAAAGAPSSATSAGTEHGDCPLLAAASIFTPDDATFYAAQWICNTWWPCTADTAGCAQPATTTATTVAMTLSLESLSLGSKALS